MPLRHQVQRIRPRRDLRLDPAELVRDGRRKTLHSGSPKSRRNHREEDLHRRVDQVPDPMSLGEALMDLPYLGPPLLYNFEL